MSIASFSSSTPAAYEETGPRDPTSAPSPQVSDQANQSIQINETRNRAIDIDREDQDGLVEDMTDDDMSELSDPLSSLLLTPTGPSIKDDARPAKTTLTPDSYHSDASSPLSQPQILTPDRTPQSQLAHLPDVHQSPHPTEQTDLESNHQVNPPCKAATPQRTSSHSQSHSHSHSHSHSYYQPPSTDPPSVRIPTTRSHSQIRNRNHNCKALSASPPSSPDVFSLAVKAEKILGLVPGTLPHARAALEHARDEVRRTASETLHAVTVMGVSAGPGMAAGRKGGHGDYPTYQYSNDYPAQAAASTSVDPGAGLSSTRQPSPMTHRDRARKAMSLIIPGAHHSTKFAVPTVVVGHGGIEEEVARERRRKAVDAVIHWQKEVASLEAAEADYMQQARPSMSGRLGAGGGGGRVGALGLGRMGTIRAK